MRTLIVVAAVAALLAAGPGPAAADDPAPPAVAAAAPDGTIQPPCDDPDIATLAVVDCAGEEGVPSLDPAETETPPTPAALALKAAAVEAAMPSPAELPRYCREHANVYFYTSSDWLRFAERLLANASPCVDYWISIPSLAADKTSGRCVQDDLVRALGPRIHVMAELHWTGWNNWMAKNGKTPEEAGAEFVRRWRGCGYLQPGETWALNEMHSGIRRNVPGARDRMIRFLDAVRQQSGVKGVAWIIGIGQQTQYAGDYKAESQEWLQDAHWWAAMENDVDVWAQEAYPNMRYWGVTDASRHARTSNLSFFLEHPLLLAENGPATVSTALAYLERTYVPLMSDAWPWTSGFGDTGFSNVDMQRFVSEQTFAVKHFSQTRPHRTPDARLAFAWAPNNTCGGKSCIDPPEFAQLTLPIIDRTASAIRESYEFGGGSQMGACGEPGEHVWCTADISGAAFNPVWLDYPTW